MKCTLIIDSLGPNPDYDPPRRDHFADDEAHHDALAVYDVPAERTVPAGTILSGPLCWMHCLPDESGWARNSEGRPVRVRPGVVRAVPCDAPCQAMFSKQVQQIAAKRRVPISVVMADIDAAVKRSRDTQTANNEPAK